MEILVLMVLASISVGGLLLAVKGVRLLTQGQTKQKTGEKVVMNSKTFKRK